MYKYTGFGFGGSAYERGHDRLSDLANGGGRDVPSGLAAAAASKAAPSVRKDEGRGSNIPALQEVLRQTENKLLADAQPFAEADRVGWISDDDQGSDGGMDDNPEEALDEEPDQEFYEVPEEQHQENTEDTRPEVVDTAGNVTVPQDDATADLAATMQVELDGVLQTADTDEGTPMFDPYRSLDIFDSGQAPALNVPPLRQYLQPPAATNGARYGEPPNSIPLPNFPPQPIVTPDDGNWPLINTSSPDPSESAVNSNSPQTTDCEVGIAISPPEHWYHRYQRGQCVSTGTTSQETLMGTASQGTSVAQPPQVIGPSAPPDPSHANANGYATGSSQNSTNTFTAFCQAPATIMNLTDLLFILALIFQSTSATLYFTSSPPPKSGHYTDPDFQSLCSTFCKETFTLLVLMFGISRLKERFLKPWIVVVGLVSFVMSVASLGAYFVYTTLGDSLMCLAGLLQVVVWRLVVLRWRDEDGRVSGVSTPSRS